MTNQELKTIMKLIDLHITMHDGGYYGNDYPEITSNGIKALKRDIQELFETSDKKIAREILQYIKNSKFPINADIAVLCEKYGVEIEE